MFRSVALSAGSCVHPGIISCVQSQFKTKQRTASCRSNAACEPHVGIEAPAMLVAAVAGGDDGCIRWQLTEPLDFIEQGECLYVPGI